MTRSLTVFSSPPSSPLTFSRAELTIAAAPAQALEATLDTAWAAAEPAALTLPHNPPESPGADWFWAFASAAFRSASASSRVASVFVRVAWAVIAVLCSSTMADFCRAHCASRPWTSASAWPTAAC